MLSKHFKINHVTSFFIIGPTKEKKDKKKKKKKGAISIVSFNDSDTGSTVRHRSSSSPKRRGRSRKESVESNESSSTTGIESPVHTARITENRNDSAVEKTVSRTEMENEIHVEHNLSYMPSVEVSSTNNHDVNWNHPEQSTLNQSKDQLTDKVSHIDNVSEPQPIPTSQNQTYPVNTSDFLDSRSAIDQSQLASFSIKTPPPSPYETAAAHYDRIRNSIDATDIAKQLQTVAAHHEESSPRSVSPATEEKTDQESADDSSVSDKRLNLDVTGRDSPLGGKRGSFHLLGDQDAEVMYPVSQDTGSQQGKLKGGRL